MKSSIQSYIICATPRSGSTLLCDLLTGSGVAGQPDSFFNFEAFDWPGYLQVSTANWETKDDFDRHYLSSILKYGTHGTTVFGMRLMWENLEQLSTRLGRLYPGIADDHARLSAAFGAPCYLYLSRKDKLAQAVSLSKAELTGLWHVNADGTERERLKPAQQPVFNSSDLATLVDELQQHDATWAAWFQQQGVKPLNLTYESLSADPQATLAKVLAALDFDPSIAKNVQPKTAKLADSLNDRWAAKFSEQSNRRISKADGQDLGFTYHVNQKGELMIMRHGKRVTQFASKNSRKHLAAIESADFPRQQIIMARLTGNYKRGNES